MGTTEPNIAFLTDRLATGGDLHQDPGIARVQLAALVDLGVTHIVDCRMEWSDEDFVAEHAPGIAYLHNGVDDAGQAMPDWWFDRAIRFARDAWRRDEAKVLVHCHMGINRGPSLAYRLLLEDDIDPVEALAVVRTARPIAGLAYAYDALNHWHRANLVDLEDRIADRLRVEHWFTDNHLDVANVIHGIRTAQGTHYQ